ncbi:MAG: integrase core domain-containing protein, partial [Akkermansiaceae bacterium]
MLLPYSFSVLGWSGCSFVFLTKPSWPSRPPRTLLFQSLLSPICETFGTLSFAWCNRFESIEHARLKLRAWIHRYNHHRPHQSLKYKSPNQYN